MSTTNQAPLIGPARLAVAVYCPECGRVMRKVRVGVVVCDFGDCEIAGQEWKQPAVWLEAVGVRLPEANDSETVAAEPLHVGDRINGKEIQSVSTLPFAAYLVDGVWVDRHGELVSGGG